MKRKFEVFNLSFLDLLSAALSSVIFLFIIVPKGDRQMKDMRTIALKLDTAAQYLYYALDPEELESLNVGDSLITLVLSHQPIPLPEYTGARGAQGDAVYADHREEPDVTTDGDEVEKAPVDKRVQPTRPVRYSNSAYYGDLPSVPCMLSVEIKWKDKSDNVDLFVCKDGRCVFGGKRTIKTIGSWDSGKSKTSLFGADLTTNQEAVRQFDEIIPGDYEIFVKFKDSRDKKDAVRIDGLIYTDPGGRDIQGETFEVLIPYSENVKVKVGDLSVQEDGKFNFKRAKI